MERFRESSDSLDGCEKDTVSQGLASQGQRRQPFPPTPFATQWVDKLLSMALAAHCAVRAAVWVQHTPQPQSSLALPAADVAPFAARATLVPAAKADSSAMWGM